MKVTCRECHEPLTVDDWTAVDDHIRDQHPGMPPLERWPDGGDVVVDLTLDPDQFKEQQ